MIKQINIKKLFGMDKDKTVVFPSKKVRDDFIYHLRSGKVKRGKGFLHDGEGYCCLGVYQCMLTGGKVESTWPGSPKPLPSFKWLRKNNTWFFDSLGCVMDDPYMPSYKKSAADMNDRHHRDNDALHMYSWNEIARTFVKHSVIISPAKQKKILDAQRKKLGYSEEKFVALFR